MESSLYAALEQAGSKLRARETVGTFGREVHVKAVKNAGHHDLEKEMDKVIQMTDSMIHKLPDLNNYLKGIDHSFTDSVFVFIEDQPQSMVLNEVRIEGHKNNNLSKVVIRKSPQRELQILNLDSARMVLEKKRKETKILARKLAAEKEYATVMSEMAKEVRIMLDDKINRDTVRAMLSATLRNKGLDQSFEFALVKRRKDGADTILKSDSFQGSEKMFESDLSVNTILRNNKFLLLQYPGLHNEVMRSMRSSLWLSLLFSLLLFAVFIYTLRLILKQKKISDMKTDFVNNMTHELKTPIATIGLAIDALNKDAVRSNARRFEEYSRILKEENRKLNQHVERVLQVSLLEKELLEVRKDQVDLVQVVSKVVSSFGLRAAGQQCEISCQLLLPQAFVRGDAAHLDAMLANLLDNALKYGGPGTKVLVRIFREDKDIVLEVQDDGPGIAAKHREKIFEKFYRVQGGDLHDVKGFGLGLSYVKSIVETHGGTIAYEEAPGRGSIFTIRLKQYEEDPAR